jgi:putative chitinase
VRFKGHGPIQITGRANHLRLRPGARHRPDRRAAADLHAGLRHGLGLLVLEQPAPVAAGRPGWFVAITRFINGGYNGLADRLQYWERNRAILGLAPVDVEREADAVKAFQHDHGLTADGAVGPMTLKALAA